MKKIWILFSVTMMLLIGNANAEMRYGFSGALTQVNASGSETEGGEKTNAEADNLVVIPSLFLEYGMGSISVGLDYIPMDADVSSKTKKRTDTETSVTGTATHTTTSRTQSAQAELTDHITLYANYMMSDTYFVKAGVASVTLDTSESLGTGSNYGNEDIYGGVFGIGYTDGNNRLEIVYTDYESISLTSTVARTGVTTNNKIEADLDTLALKYSYAF
jgi:hypothetical protein